MSEILHPKIFDINGFKFQIAAQCELSDDEAAKIAMRFYRSRKFAKKDRCKVFQVRTEFDRDSAGLL